MNNIYKNYKSIIIDNNESIDVNNKHITFNNTIITFIDSNHKENIKLTINGIYELKENHSLLYDLKESNIVVILTEAIVENDRYIKLFNYGTKRIKDGLVLDSYLREINKNPKSIGLLPVWVNDYTRLNAENMNVLNRAIQGLDRQIGSGALATANKSLIGAINELHQRPIGGQGESDVADIVLRSSKINLVDTRGNIVGEGIEKALLDGLSGKSVEYMWKGTELGIRVEGDLLYTFVDLKGIRGTQGFNGSEGKSVYQVALDNGYSGSEIDFIASLKGDRGIQGGTGLKGETGLTGSVGLAGDRGLQGERGIQGLVGNSIEFIWNDTELGIRETGDLNYIYSDLKGEQGSIGLTGKSLEYVWKNTELGIRVEGEVEYQYINLKGERGGQGIQGERGFTGETGAGLNVLGNLTSEEELPTTGISGDAYFINGDLYVYDSKSTSGKPFINVGNVKGEKGDSFEYLWNGTSLGIKTDKESEYIYVDLKGQQGLKGDDSIYIGDLEPTDESVVWLDTDSVSESDKLKQEVSELKIICIELNRRIEVLESSNIIDGGNF